MIHEAVGRSGIAYRVDGPVDGPAIVLLNSLGTTHRMWDGQLPALEGWRVVRYEANGHGESTLRDGPVTIETLADDLVALLDHVSIRRTVLCGCSMGGLLAIQVAATHPDRVAGAVLANTGAKVGSLETWTTRIAAVRSGGMAAIREGVVRRFLSEGFRVTHPEVGARIGDMLEGVNPDGYVAVCEALRDADLHPLLPRVQVPTLVVGGAMDESTPPALAEVLHRRIAGSELEILPTAHLSMVELPGAFNDRLRRFLDSVPRRVA
jgi:3-oxoadipate enol-lactonase